MLQPNLATQHPVPELESERAMSAITKLLESDSPNVDMARDAIRELQRITHKLFGMPDRDLCKFCECLPDLALAEAEVVCLADPLVKRLEDINTKRSRRALAAMEGAILKTGKPVVH